MSIKSKLTAAPINVSRHHLREWAGQAAGVGTDKSHRVLDVGAGDAPYRELFSHVTYETADLAVYSKDYADLTHVCDITDMPMPDDTYDQVFCSQTLEHVREPARAMGEIARVLKPGGTAWLSAPLFFEEHEKPYDFFRYTQFGWQELAEGAGLEVRSIDRLEGYHGTLAYQLHMAAKSLPTNVVMRALFLLLARRYAKKDLRQPVKDRGMSKNYCVVLASPTR